MLLIVLVLVVAISVIAGKLLAMLLPQPPVEGPVYRANGCTQRGHHFLGAVPAYDGKYPPFVPDVPIEWYAPMQVQYDWMLHMRMRKALYAKKRACRRIWESIAQELMYQAIDREEQAVDDAAAVEYLRFLCIIDYAGLLPVGYQIALPKSMSININS